VQALYPCGIGGALSPRCPFEVERRTVELHDIGPMLNGSQRRSRA
jgi:hypothetical protein